MTENTTGGDVLELLRERLGLEGETPSLTMAVTHPSFTNERPGHADNQRLEFLGDAVLGLCVSEMLMTSFAHVDEGQLTVMRASLVNAGALARVARALELAGALRMGRGAAAGGERNRKNVLADAMEAVIGAVFTDLGLDACRQLTERLLGDDVRRLVDSGGIRRDAKSRLQEWLQARGAPPPVYTVVATEGPPHARNFVVEVVIESTDVVTALSMRGEGRSKKIAEQTAASATLDTLEARTDPS